jgi:ornithine cyclodeaminase
MTSGIVRVISGRQLRDLVPMADAIEAVRGGFQAVSEGKIEQAPRTALPDGSLLTMAAHGTGSSGTSVKVLGVRQDATQDQMPLINAVVLWFDHASGRPVAVIEGSELTALRTGAASGVATDLLAAPGACVLAIIGSGAQAADQVFAVCSVRRINTVRIFSRNAATAADLAKRLSSALPEVEFRVPTDIHSATAGADVICTATTATTPLIHGGDLSERTHINAIGAYRPDMCEISPEVIAEATIVAIDHSPSARAEAGDLLQAAAAGRFALHDAIELGKLMSLPRRAYTGWTVFKSVGISAQDWAVAKLAVERSDAHELPKISLR